MKEVKVNRCGKRSTCGLTIERKDKVHGEILEFRSLYVILKRWPPENFFSNICYSDWNHEVTCFCFVLMRNKLQKFIV